MSPECQGPEEPPVGLDHQQEAVQPEGTLEESAELQEDVGGGGHPPAWSHMSEPQQPRSELLPTFTSQRPVGLPSLVAPQAPHNTSTSTAEPRYEGTSLSLQPFKDGGKTPPSLGLPRPRKLDKYEINIVPLRVPLGVPYRVPLGFFGGSSGSSFESSFGCSLRGSF